MPKTVLVTGAGGFVCGHLARGLLQRGYSLVLADRQFDTAAREFWESHKVPLVETDINELPEMDISGIDVLIHGAATTATPEETRLSPESYFQSELGSALSTFSWAERQGVKRVIFISSAAVFAGSTSSSLDETSLPAPRHPYGVIKRALEEIISNLHDVYERSIVSVRLSNLYGPAEQSRTSRPRVSLVQRMIHDALEQGELQLPSATPKRDWTFVKDLAKPFHALLQAAELRHSLYHLTSGEMLGEADIAYQIQACLPHKEIRISTAPPNETFQRGHFTSSRLTEFAFEDWTPFTRGLRETINEYSHSR